jgi:hypothetical protein
MKPPGGNPAELFHPAGKEALGGLACGPVKFPCIFETGIGDLYLTMKLILITIPWQKAPWRNSLAGRQWLATGAKK